MSGFIDEYLNNNFNFDLIQNGAAERRGDRDGTQRRKEEGGKEERREEGVKNFSRIAL